MGRLCEDTVKHQLSQIGQKLLSLKTCNSLQRLANENYKIWLLVGSLCYPTLRHPCSPTLFMRNGIKWSMSLFISSNSPQSIYSDPDQKLQRCVVGHAHWNHQWRITCDSLQQHPLVIGLNSSAVLMSIYLQTTSRFVVIICPRLESLMNKGNKKHLPVIGSYISTVDKESPAFVKPPTAKIKPGTSKQHLCFVLEKNLILKSFLS